MDIDVDFWWIFLALMCIFFIGEPDIHDAIIYALMKTIPEPYYSTIMQAIIPP